MFAKTKMQLKALCGRSISAERVLATLEISQETLKLGNVYQNGNAQGAFPTVSPFIFIGCVKMKNSNEKAAKQL
jgi:hypothetical protein